MKNTIVFLFALLSTVGAFAQSGIDFNQNKWEAILAEARESDKIIFLDAYASWCGPCKMMSKDVFSHAEVAQYYNEHFINAKIDMEKGEGPKLARQYQVMAYPTLLFIDGDGELVHRAVGYHDPKQFYQLGEAAMDPARRLSGLSQRYIKGERDPEFLYNYARMSMNAMDEKSDAIAKAYLDTQKDWKTPRNMELIIDVAESADSKLFDFIIENRAAFDELYGEALVANKIQRMIISSLEGEDEAGTMDKVEALYTKAYEDEAPRLIANFKMNYYSMLGQKDNFAKAAIEYMDEYGSDDANELNNISWAFFESVEDKAQLAEAVKWAEKSVKLNDQYYNNDTVASLYYKLGKKKPAKKAALHAIELAKAGGSDYSATEELLEKIEQL
jgi:thioredoxin-related protein